MKNLNHSARIAIGMACSALIAGCGGGGSHNDSISNFDVSSDGITATTLQGTIKGKVNATTFSFRGIPFALAPVGARRWQPPVAAPSWSSPIDATKFANHCPQPTAAGATIDGSEDCLYLNVYTPTAIGTATPGNRRPVMVWFYGGANAQGASDYYDPTPLVQQEDVIVVTVNYRIGALGFLAHPALDAEGHTNVNYGVMDQQLALKWVRDNIASLGGDAGNVTIFGESAGGLNVTTHLASPLSAGLFQKAIIQSGAYQLDTSPLAAAETMGTSFATRLGCTDQSATCLRGKSVAEVIAQQGTVNTAGSAFPQSTQDGKVLVESQRSAIVAGRINRVPVMQGYNAHEGRAFTSPTITVAGYQATIGAFAAGTGKTAADALALYPLSTYGTPFEAASAALGDFGFACSGRNSNQALSQWVPTYAYEFLDENASVLGSSHGSEIIYLMDVNSAAGTGSNSGRGWAGTGDSLALSRTMRKYWAQFARTGNPNATGIPTWTPYLSVTDNVQYLTPPTPVQDMHTSTRHLCSFWG
ncbi:MAG: carboxylesterase/lipase family protein [Janthinobacterium lividum]